MQGKPMLGILLDEARRKPGQYLLYPTHMSPIPSHRKRMEWLDDMTPIYEYRKLPPVLSVASPFCVN